MCEPRLCAQTVTTTLSSRVKHLIRNSPLGPLALFILRQRLPYEARKLAEKNAQYDRQLSQVLARVLRANSNCIDVGAHKGTLLFQMMKQAPHGRHYAIEPLPHLAEHLRWFFKRAKVIEAACADVNGRADFLYVRNQPGYSGLRRRIYERPHPLIETIQVDVVRLDDVIEDKIDLIKLDIEGGEYHALRGAIGILTRDHPYILFEGGPKSTGQYGISAQDMWHFLHSLEYEVSTMERWLSGKPGESLSEFSARWTTHGDFFFMAYKR